MLALEQTAQLLGLLSLIQAIEYLILKKTWSDQGVWRWSTLQKEISVLTLFLSEKYFLLLNIFRIAIAAIAIVQPDTWCVGLLLFVHVLTVIRWLGSFNGGSDYMSSLLLLFTWVGMLWPATLGAICLSYIAFQLCYSYLKAGWVKLKNKDWRQGKEISKFVLSPMYSKSHLLNRVFQSKTLAFFISWGIILFEVSYPLALLHKNFAICYILLGTAFHFVNAYVFGLNRFIYAWVAAYPALYWCAGLLFQTPRL